MELTIAQKKNHDLIDFNYKKSTDCWIVLKIAFYVTQQFRKNIFTSRAGGEVMLMFNRIFLNKQQIIIFTSYLFTDKIIIIIYFKSMQVKANQLLMIN